MSPELEKKGVEVASKALKALEDAELLSELLEGLRSKKDIVRSKCFEVLYFISEKNPDKLYSKWDFFATMLKSDNTYHKLIAVKILANLTHVDVENRFERLFDQYYNLLNNSVIIAGHLAACSGTIAKAKPEIRFKITRRLLSIDKSTQKHKDLVKAYAIEAFNDYFEEAENKSEILQFVREQLNSESPKTKKKAKQFLRTWG
jgi:hypothetical protein